jgi:hypothetical protein
MWITNTNVYLLLESFLLELEHCLEIYTFFSFAIAVSTSG